MKKPILSICIPTYNRSRNLQKTIESIVSQKEFTTGEVEVVISDNASIDDTEAVVKSYCQKFVNVRYYKNEVNQNDRNFPLVISKANGTYRKLCNDTMLFGEGSLVFLLKAIKENAEKKPVLFWTSHVKSKNIVETIGLDDILRRITYWATSISCFGIWEEDFVYNENGCNEHLWQVSNLFDNIAKKRYAVIYTNKFYEIQNVEKKDLSYGVFAVFHTNFLKMVSDRVRDGEVTKKTYDLVEKKLLLYFFRDMVVINRLRQQSYRLAGNEGMEKDMQTVYGQKKYYWYYRFRLFLSLARAKIKVSKT